MICPHGNPADDCFKCDYPEEDRELKRLRALERVLVDHIAEIYAHTLSPDGNNPEQPMSIKEICENCIESLKGVDQ